MHFTFSRWQGMLISLLFFGQNAIADNSTLSFPNACVSGKSIVIAAVGDVLLHQPLLKTGWKKGFDSLWLEAIPYIQSADFAYANLEGPLAFGVNESGRIVRLASNELNTQIYTGYPSFNYPPNLAGALKSSGFDIVSTANNHALDRFSIGIDKTTEALGSHGIPYVGTRAKDSTRPWVYILTKEDFKIAWLACTEHTNGYVDKHHQVLHCYNKADQTFIINKIRELKKEVDAIIISPHWGEEYQTQPTSAQTNFAHQVLDAGATAVIGSHPHVLQPLQKYLTADGRATLIMYSLGNFISYQGAPKQRTTIILLLGLTKTPQGTIINGVRFVPLYMQNRSGMDQLYLTLPKNDAKTLPYQIMSNVLPMGNALYANPIVTNPECR